MPEVSTPALHPFVAQLPASSRHLVMAWFRHAAHQRPASAEALLVRVERVIGDKFAWSTTWHARQTCSLTLLALRQQRPQALDYAQRLMETRHG
jgi:hypothetical protein